MSTGSSVGIHIGQLSAGVNGSTPNRGLYRIHLVDLETLEVVTEGMFSDYRTVAKDLQEARENAIYQMGLKQMDLSDYAILVELIGYF